MRFTTKRKMAVLLAAGLMITSLPGGTYGEAQGLSQTGSAAEEAAGVQSEKGIAMEGTVEEQAGTDSAAEGAAAVTAEKSSAARETAAKKAEEEQDQVVFSRESGTYPEAFELELSFGDSDAVIYYTTDGSDPSDASNTARIACISGTVSVTDRKNAANVLSAIDPILYDAVNVTVGADLESFVSTVEKPADEDVDKCTVIKAAAEYSDGSCTDVITNTYFVGDMAEHVEGIQESCEAAGMELSVMSISMDADDLFDSQKGIYVKGDVFDQALEEYIAEGGEISSQNAVDVSRELDANYKQKGKDWERATHIDYFESDGVRTTCELQQDCGIRIQGNYSRSDYQKSFRLYARDDYGTKNFKYGFWEDALDDEGNVIEKYKKIVLRNGGNCAFTTKFSDAYWQSLLEDIDCDNQSARPCVVYLNGEYWGVYILQDDFCGAYMENKHGVDKDSVVIYKGDAEANRVLGYKLDEGELPEGETDENYYFRELEAFMSSHDDLSREEDYEAFAQLVDVDSALDYFATEVWINNKWDWPGKNWSMWKTTSVDETNPYADGRWRFLVYDVEFGGISGSSDTKANTVKTSKLLETGTAEYGDTNYDKPNVRCFALLMTNQGFRERYIARLESFSAGMFEYEHIIEVANRFKEVYQPILQQFFDRFPTEWNGSKKTAEMVINGNGGDTYGTWINIVRFVEGRAEYIPTIASWIRRQYGESSVTPSPSATPAVAPTAGPSSVPSETEAPATEVPATEVPAATSPATAVPSPAGNVPSPAPAVRSVETTLSDGAVKREEINPDGTVLSTTYQVDGIVYLLKADNTLSYAAENNTSLKKRTAIAIGDKVTAGGKQYRVTGLQAGAFQGLTKLKRVTVGANVTTIGKNTFRGCKNLKRIDLKTKKLKKVGANAVKGIHRKAMIHCPKAKKKAYRKLFSAKTGYQKRTMSLT